MQEEVLSGFKIGVTGALVKMSILCVKFPVKDSNDSIDDMLAVMSIQIKELYA